MNATASTSATATTSPIPGARLGAGLRLTLSASLCATVTWLLVLAEPLLPGQRLSPRGIGAWLMANPPDVVVARLMWGLGLLLGCYLVALHLAALVAVLFRSARLLRRLDLASGGLVRKLGAGAVAAGLCGTMASVVPAGAVHAEDQSIPTSADHTGQYRSASRAGVARGELATGPSMTLLRQALDNGPPPMRLITPTTSPTASAWTTSSTASAAQPGSFVGSATPLMRLVELPARPEVAAPGSAAAPTSTVDGSRWVVGQGDNLWDIAAAVQARAGVHDGGLIRGYWLELISANSDQLSDPANPDLIFVGQQLRLPPLR